MTALQTLATPAFHPGPMADRPDPEVPDRARRRTFNARYKLAVLTEKEISTMTANPSIDPDRFLAERLERGEPDLLPRVQVDDASGEAGAPPAGVRPHKLIHAESADTFEPGTGWTARRRLVRDPAELHPLTLNML
jgi:hypothetical protein